MQMADTITLKDGSREPLVLVTSTMVTLDKMMEDGRVHDSIKAIVRNAVTVDGATVTLSNPKAADQSPEDS